ncbi:hypothetical protein K488DRAFT_51028 [Vararia minispora EC-137]|uniref:Uncharacterized protein n=1 Tax=Vararia minispora EC-137 TaxID=1314806 RepID=A0ACB8QKP4_9AGAM|nr:hypothetical protein K488DRAFT_51028 [Vararia minispora EC-137]
MEAPKPIIANSSQPQATLEMSTLLHLNPSPPILIVYLDATNSAPPTQKHQHKAERVRGGGAGRDCFLGMIECFICFECCKGCCECFADIICCPCEMCC